MSPTPELQRWVQAQYHSLGADQKGHFIGKKAFKNLLIDRYPTTYSGRVPKQEIRQLVNRQGLFSLHSYRSSSILVEHTTRSEELLRILNPLILAFH